MIWGYPHFRKSPYVRYHPMQSWRGDVLFSAPARRSRCRAACHPAWRSGWREGNLWGPLGPLVNNHFLHESGHFGGIHQFRPKWLWANEQCVEKRNYGITLFGVQPLDNQQRFFNPRSNLTDWWGSRLNYAQVSSLDHLIFPPPLSGHRTIIGKFVEWCGNQQKSMKHKVFSDETFIKKK